MTGDAVTQTFRNLLPASLASTFGTGPRLKRGRGTLGGSKVPPNPIAGVSVELNRWERPPRSPT